MKMNNNRRKLFAAFTAVLALVLFTGGAAAQISFSNEDPADGSTVLSSEYMDGNIVASIDVSNTNGNDMNVQFVNAADDGVYETDFDVPPGGTAEMVDSGNTLRDNTFQTYNWYVYAQDQVTGDSATSQTFTFDTSSPSSPSSSNVQPADGSVFDAGSSSSYDVDFNWDVSAGDESGTARLYVDGTEVYSEGFNADQTISMSHTESVGVGSHTYELVLETDYYGGITQVSRSFEVEQDAAPDVPSNPDPADGATVPVLENDGDIAASILVSQEDENTMNVQFVNASNDVPLETDFDLQSGERAKMTGLGNTFRDEPSTTYEWYAIATDQETGKSTESPTFTFTTEESQPVPPSSISLSNPSDGASFSTNGSSVDIGFDFSIESEEESGTARIILNDTEIFSESFDSRSSQSFSHTESVTNGTYTWYVETETATYVNTSETRSFSVDAADLPAPETSFNPFPENNSEVGVLQNDGDIAASVEVFQENGNIMNVQFVNASNDVPLETDYDVQSGERAKMTGIGNTLRDEVNRTYNWYAIATDQETGKTNISSVFTFTTVEDANLSAPFAPYDPIPENGSTVNVTENDGEIVASVKVDHPEGREMNVQFVNASNDVPLETDYNVDAGERAKMTGLGNTLRDKPGTTYKWYAIAYDTQTGETTSSDVWTFTTSEDVAGQIVTGFMEAIGQYWKAFKNNTGPTAQAFIGLVLMLGFGGLGYAMAGSVGGSISMILVIIVNTLAGLFPGWIALSLVILAVTYVFLSATR